MIVEDILAYFTYLTLGTLHLLTPSHLMSHSHSHSHSHPGNGATGGGATNNKFSLSPLLYFKLYFTLLYLYLPYLDYLSPFPSCIYTIQSIPLAESTIFRPSPLTPCPLKDFSRVRLCLAFLLSPRST